MNVTPSSTARRATSAAARSSVGRPQSPGPVSHIAPYPRRPTVRSPPSVRFIIAFVVIVVSRFAVAPAVATPPVPTVRSANPSPNAFDCCRNLEDDGGVAGDQHPVLAVPCDGAGQHHALDVGSLADHVLQPVPVGHPDQVLLDDRSLVEVLGHVVRGRADELDPPLPGALVRSGTGERG